MNTTQAIEPEVLPPLDTKLISYAGQTGLEKQSTETLVEAFRPIFAKARKAIADAAGVAESVKDATCVREIMKSRACRLALRKIRLESDEAREKHKKHALLYGRAVDGFHNILLADLVPVETSLKEAEEIAERAEAKRLAQLKAAREAELGPLLDTPILGNLSDLSEGHYQKMLSDAKLLRQAKIDAAAKVEAERKAKEEAERIERERIAAENERLKAEAVAREEKAKAAAEQAARERAEIEAKAKMEAARLAEEARKEQAAALAKAKAESDRLAAIAAEERKRLEAKAKAEAEKAAQARAELAAKEKAEKEERARLEALAEKARAEAKAAAAAPDRAKVNLFAGTLRDMARVKLNDEHLSDAIWTRVNELAEWCDEQAQSL